MASEPSGPVSAPLVTLLTDFGLRDGYVGAMKGVLLRRCPGARLVDLSHEIPPGAIDAAGYVLRQSAPWFPRGTVHVAVVDPGVGSARRAVVVTTEDHRYVAPDNGLLTLVLEEAPPVEVRSIENRDLWERDVSAVFHGRDLFAPVAAHLASNGDPAIVGPEVSPDMLVRRPWPMPEERGSVRQGSVVYVDRFGNLVTNLPVAASEIAMGSVEVERHVVPVVRTYGDVAMGELLAYRGSAGLLEVACREGNAATRLGGGPGLVVTWRLRPGS
jgi:S-adenosylmethionine hydrolase